MRVIDEDGSQLGIMKRMDALNLAASRGLDLVEIAPTAEISVCRIMDYGKFKFEKSKKDREARKRQVVVELKEVQLSVRIGQHDLDTKFGHAKKFLEEGNKVKACLIFNRGREMVHMDLGYKMLERFVKMCEDLAVIEKPALREGRRITVILAPKKAKSEKTEKPSPAEAADK